MGDPGPSRGTKRKVRFEPSTDEATEPEDPAGRRPRGRIIQDDSESDEDSKIAKAKTKAPPRRPLKPAELCNMDEEELKVFVAARKHALAEKALLGTAETPCSELTPPDDLAGYEKEMGYTIEPFNTEEERRTGRFDAAGFWMKEKEEDEVADPWLAEVDDAGRQGVAKPRVSSQGGAADEDEASPVDEAQHYKALLAVMQPGETLTRTIRRLKPVKPPPKRSKSKSQSEAPAPEPEGEPTASAATNSEAFNRLMEAAHTLLDAGVMEIYSFTYEELEQRLAALDPEQTHRLSLNQEPCGPVVEAPAKKWELCWSLEPGAEVHGPFTSAEMQAWQAHGCFSAERAAHARLREEDMFATEEPPWREAHLVDFTAPDT